MVKLALDKQYDRFVHALRSFSSEPCNRPLVRGGIAGLTIAKRRNKMVHFGNILPANQCVRGGVLEDTF